MKNPNTPENIETLQRILMIPANQLAEQYGLPSQVPFLKNFFYVNTDFSKGGVFTPKLRDESEWQSKDVEKAVSEIMKLLEAKGINEFSGEQIRNNLYGIVRTQKMLHQLNKNHQATQEKIKDKECRRKTLATLIKRFPAGSDFATMVLLIKKGDTNPTIRDRVEGDIKTVIREIDPGWQPNSSELMDQYYKHLSGRLAESTEKAKGLRGWVRGLFK